MGVSDLLKLGKSYGTVLAVVGGITFAAAWVHGREQLAVARAELRHYTDSVSVKLQADSAASAQRDAASAIVIAGLKKSRNDAESAAKMAGDSVTSLEAAVAAAKTPADTIVAQAAVIVEQKKQILSLSDALAQAKTEIAKHERAENDLRHDLSSVRSDLAGALGTLRAQERHPLLQSTPVKLVETALAVYGAVSLARGH